MGESAAASYETSPLRFNEDACTGCNRCVEACTNDVLTPNPEKRKPPMVFNSNDCWYCGCCVMECPRREEGAIEVRWPIKTKLRWKRKDAGQHFRVDMPNQLAPNLIAPVGGWDAILPSVPGLE